MKRIKNGLAASVLALCVASPAMAAGARGGMGSPMASPTMTRPTTTTTTTTGHATTTTSTPSPRALGQPNQSCETTPNTPGNAASARGSAFNPDGVAGKVYAGEQPQNSRNPASVSQYDVACTRP